MADAKTSSVITPFTPPDQLPFILTVKQVAQWLNWSEATVRRKIHEGLPAIPAGDSERTRQYRIPRDALLQWLNTEATSRKKDEFTIKPREAARLQVVK